ncbi:polysaccharide export outer membrane protein [Flavobacterium fontis]|uniref:Polysaccharide export outer membrane protein n=1 Tax=Flavobacterium fontis TaxID=1124188 RepID=A0A1M4WRB9_9FLAO|nr:polysaccharide biosynthesis/export family protein [Flavobacterium fontis]SHE83775.1 polysaccharide export outer membrane protein [Flavobacterium fontis]
MKNTIFFLLFLIINSACTSKKDIIYFNNLNTETTDKTQLIKSTITKNDILSIVITSSSAEIVKAYNMEVTQSSNGYLVSSEGFITLPVLGKINANGISCMELEQIIANLLISGGHLSNPVVNVRVINSKFTVLGEVNKPGTYNYQEENISLLQALGYAGDLTINGVRNNIYLIREEGNVLNYTKIDLTSKDWFSSPYYYLKPNDVIYVLPNDAKVKSGGYVKSLGNLLTITSVSISTILAIILLTK